MLNRRIGWRLLLHWHNNWCVESTRCLTLTDALAYWLMCWIDILVDVYWLMNWRVGWCVGSTCWFTFTHALTYRLMCWIDIWDYVYWLMHWLVGWCVESTRWFMLTNALTYWLVCWIDVLFFEFFCSVQLLWPVAFGYKKKQEKNYIFITYSKGWKPSFCCTCGVKCKAQYNLNRAMIRYIHVKEVLYNIRYIITLSYTSVINVHTTPSKELVWFWMLFVNDVLIIFPRRIISLIVTDASIDPTPFIICSITPTSTILITSPMIMSISTILIFITILIHIDIHSLIIISISTILTISLIISTISYQIRIVWFGKHRTFVFIKYESFLIHFLLYTFSWVTHF